MASKDRIKLFFGAGLALAVGAVFADTPTTPDVVSQTFQTTDAIGTGALSSWDGDGTVETVAGSSITIGNNVARPIDDDGTKFLAIAGTVTCTGSGTTGGSGSETTGGYYVSDFLVNITEGSDEELAKPDGVQIAVAAGQAITDGNAKKIPLFVYCIPKSDDPSTDPDWVDTGILIPINTTTWHRLTLVFDYTKNTCQVNWDGVPVATSAGYLESDPKSAKNIDGEKQIAGSWYKLATGDSKSSIATLKFVGAASIDDVLVKQGAKTDVKPAYGESAVATVKLDGTDVTIPVKDLSNWGVGEANITTAKIDNSGLTVAEKLAAGLEPDDGKKFELTGMTLAADGTPTITFPGSATAKYGVQPNYTVKVTDGSDKVVDGATAAVSAAATGGGMQAAITLPENPPAVLKFKITATATAPTSTSTQATAE